MALLFNDNLQHSGSLLSLSLSYIYMKTCILYSFAIWLNLNNNLSRLYSFSVIISVAENQLFDLIICRIVRAQGIPLCNTCTYSDFLFCLPSITLVWLLVFNSITNCVMLLFILFFVIRLWHLWFLHGRMLWSGLQSKGRLVYYIQHLFRRFALGSILHLLYICSV